MNGREHGRKKKVRFNLARVKSRRFDSDSMVAYSASPFKFRVEEMPSSMASSMSIHGSNVYVKHLEIFSLSIVLGSFAQ